MSDQPPAPAPVHPDDVIQITDEADRWFPAILVVTEVRAWGVMCFAFAPGARMGETYYRIRHGAFAVIGEAAMTTPDRAKARTASIETARLLAAEAGEA